MPKKVKINKEVQDKAVVSEKTKYYNDTLESKSQKKNKGFFTKRNMILLIIFFIVSLALLGLTIKFIININWKLLSNSIRTGLGRKIGYLWFALLFVYFFWCVFTNFNTLMTRYKQYGIKIPFSQYLLFSFTLSFLRAVAPWPLPDTYIIFWLKTQNIPTHIATSISFSNTLLWQIAKALITLPSFILIMVNYEKLIYISGKLDSQGLAIMILSCVGVFIDYFTIAFVLLLNMSKKVHYGLSTLFNKIKKVFRMKYHTKAEIEEKYKNKAVLKQDFILFIKDWKCFLLTLFYFALGEIIAYIALVWSLYFVQTYNIDGNLYTINFNFGWVFSCANVASSANRINILPNGIGGLEWILSVMLGRMGGWVDPIKFENPTEVHKIVTNNAILIWRLFGGYLQAFVGLFTLIGITILQTKSIKAQNKISVSLLK